MKIFFSKTFNGVVLAFIATWDFEKNDLYSSILFPIKLIFSVLLKALST